MVTLEHASDMLFIGEGVRIPRRELRFRFSKSSGPGGQNLNKVSTRATLRFDLEACGTLTADQRRRIRRRLATRITRHGVLQVVAARHRTQAANRRAATQRFVELLAEVLKTAKRRKKTVTPRSAHQRRLREKALRTRTKRLRRGVESDGDD